MTTLEDILPGGAPLLFRERIIARPGFNRWLVPPAALTIHLCIGMAYGFSVFWLPLSHAIGISNPAICKGMSLLSAPFTTSCDWRIADLGWIYTLFFVLVGSSSAIRGGWLETAGPRKAGVVAALCWCGGMVVSGIGVMTHQLWQMWLGSGCIGGIGLGLGYISPVSTLIKWFPDGPDYLDQRGESACQPFASCRVKVTIRRLCQFGAGGVQRLVIGGCRSGPGLGQKRAQQARTARDSITERMAGLKAGADDYLVKPYDLDEMQAEDALARRLATVPGMGVISSSAFAATIHIWAEGDRDGAAEVPVGQHSPARVRGSAAPAGRQLGHQC